MVERRGRVVASIGPAAAASGRDVKRLLRTHRPDRAWESDLRALRDGLAPQERRWSG